MPTRVLVLSCNDWPVVAQCGHSGEPIAVHGPGGVLTSNPAARAMGVEVGLTLREAQRRCPGLRLVSRDQDVEARAFEPLLRSLEDVTAYLEVISPGMCAFPMVGPTRFFGGETELGIRVVEVARALLGHGAFGVGIADGVASARLAAVLSGEQAGDRGGAPLLVPEGESRSFIARYPVDVLGPSELVEVLRGLGLGRVGDFAALPPSDVLARFGTEGRDALRVAQGEDLRDLELSEPPQPIEVSIDLDPPLERVDQAAFVSRSIAAEFHAQLAPRGLMCSLLLISAETTSGRRSERYWRHEGGLGPAGIAQRVRWQLDGWLTDVVVGRFEQPGALSRLSLRARHVAAARGRQGDLWGGGTPDSDIFRGVARVQALLGHDSVQVLERQGGRSVSEQYRLVSIDAVDMDARDGGLMPGDEPWPGSLPGPAPAMVWKQQRPAELVDVARRDVVVSGRGELSAPPFLLSIASGSWDEVVSWAGPWLYDERWWEATGHRRRARIQVVTEQNAAHLLSLEGGSWWCEATYD